MLMQLSDGNINEVLTWDGMEVFSFFNSVKAKRDLMAERAAMVKGKHKPKVNREEEDAGTN
jgi:hypothetical protein